MNHRLESLKRTKISFQVTSEVWWSSCRWAFSVTLDCCRKKLFIHLKVHWYLRLHKSIVWGDISLNNKVACKWHQTRGFDCWIPFITWFIQTFTNDAVVYVMYTYLYYYVITYSIPFLIKLSSVLMKRFDLVVMYYIRQGIQLRSLGILSALFLKL